MKRPPQFALKLPRWHEGLIYGTVGALVASGVAWLLLDRFGKVAGEFGPEPSPSLPWLLLTHGVAAYAFAIVAAMLIPVHMRLGWVAHRNRRSGVTLVTLSAFLVLSGLALYYATSEWLRPLASLTHWVAGLALPLLVLIHLLRGRRSTAARARPKGHTD